MAWILVAALYAIGLIGLHATARDVQQAPIRSPRAWLCLVFWPIVIPFAYAGDLYDRFITR